MFLKKFAAPVLAGLLTALLLTAPAFAHGDHCHSGQSYAAPQAQPTIQSACPEGCTQTGWHSHQGIAYCGYHHTSNTCNGLCASLCGVEGCTEPGRHTHDGALLCGYAHEDGYCDGSCTAILAAQALREQLIQAWSGWSFSGCHGGSRSWHC